MAFKLKYECEYCFNTLTVFPNELPDQCPYCSDTGDDRTNLEKYDCKNCSHYNGQNMCDLENVWNIEDIICPLQK